MGQYFIAIPLPLEIVNLPEPLKLATLPERIIALDLGVRTFQAGYDPSGTCFEWGKGDMGRIVRLGYAIDKIQSRLDTEGVITGKKRWKLKRAANRMRKKIKDLIKDCHRKLAKFLCESFDHILLPTFETSQMTTKTPASTGKRKINSKTVRAMLTCSHYSFKQTLLSKSREYPWVKVHIVNEAYTSKTCTCCGAINDKLGGSKVFNCKSCGAKIDRDFNGARNILLKNERELGFFGPGTRCELAPSGWSIKNSSQMQEMTNNQNFLWFDTQSFN